MNNIATKAKLSERRLDRLWKSAGVAVLSLCLLLPLAELAQQPAPISVTSNRHYQQWRWFYQQRAFPLGYIPAGVRRKALGQLNQMLQQEAKIQAQAASSHAAMNSGAMSIIPSTNQWTLIGPEPTNTQNGNIYMGGPVTSGRVTALAVDPTNSSVVYLGGAEGGVWKTTDGGAHWTPLTDTQASLSVGSLALDPSSPTTVYVGTGEDNFNGDAYYGAGILKSMDGGSTWTQLGASTFAGPYSSSSYCGGAYIGGVAVDPANGQIVLAAVQHYCALTGSGVYRSIDGGSTWTKVLSGPSGTVVFFDPTNGNIAYAALGDFGNSSSGVYKSTNAGATWARADAGSANPLPTTNMGRIALALAPTSTSTLYAGIANTLNGSLLGMFKSTDGGANWSALSSAPDYCSPQCWYDNVIVVDPVSANDVFAGGVYHSSDEILVRSLDGGSTWATIDRGANGVNLHTDMHALALANDGSALFVGDDGGVWSTSTPTSAAGSINWSDLNSPLAITQIYPGLSIHPTNANSAIDGTQDNGTQTYGGNLSWNYVACGDGGWNAIDTSTPTTFYAACAAFIGVFKSTSSGNLGTWVSAQSGINTSDRSLFVPPMVMDLSSPSILYYGTYRVYQTRNGASSWSAITGDLTAGGGGDGVTAIAVAPANSNTVYAGTSDARVWVTTNAGAGTGSTWTNISSGLPNRYITQVAADPVNSQIAYVTCSGFSGFTDTKGHVFKTTSGGASWNDISGNLPNTPANDIVVDPDIANTLYVATDIGVFSTRNGGSTWSTLVTGLPRVAVISLKLHRPSRTLRAATHGRSAWDLNVPFKKRHGQVISD